MTKDGVRDFIAAEYTLSENYMHGLAAFGPRLKKFESPHPSRGSSPGLPAGNSVKARLTEIDGDDGCVMRFGKAPHGGGFSDARRPVQNERQPVWIRFPILKAPVNFSFEIHSTLRAGSILQQHALCLMHSQRIWLSLEEKSRSRTVSRIQ